MREVQSTKSKFRFFGYTSLVVAVAIFLLAIFSFATSFVSGFFGLLVAFLLFPKSAILLEGKITLLKNKFIRYVLITVCFLIFIFSNNGTIAEYSIGVKKSSQTSQRTLDFQRDITELAENYKDAQIRSLVITQIKFGGAELSEAERYIQETSEAWARVESSAEKMQREYARSERDEQKISFFDRASASGRKDIIKVAFDSSSPANFDSNNSEVQLNDSDKNLIQTKWDMVEVRRAVSPDKSIIKAVSDEFGTSARKSKELIDHYHGGMADVWNDEEKYAKSRENLFRGLKTASSVGLTIGGGVVFMGELAAVSVAPTLVSGMKLAAETAVLAFAKTDMVLEVLETGVIVATGDEKNAAAITNTRKTTSLIKNLISVKDLIKNPTLADGGNIETIDGLKDVAFEYGKAGVEKAGKLFLFERGDDQYKVKVQEKFSPMSSDGIVKDYFPKNFEYEFFEWGDDYYKEQLKIKEQAESKKKDYKGDSACWRGSKLDDETYQKILKHQDKHFAAKSECEKELGVKVELGHPRWLEVMQCACDKDPEAAVARTYCCAGITMEEIGKQINESIRSIQESGGTR